MDKPIGVGDLVRVVKWPCCDAIVGRFFVVADMRSWPKANFRCTRCDVKMAMDNTVFIRTSLNGPPNGGWMPVERVKRVPPLEDLEGLKTEEGIRTKEKA